MKKYRIAAISLAVLLLLGSVMVPAGVKAWFTDRDEEVNTFSVGINTIVPDEPFDPPKPGTTTEKSPGAVNTGTIPCYVRARVAVSDSSAEEYLTFLYQGHEGMNTENWIPAEDGWLYLQQGLEPGETSVPVFDQIALAENIPEEEKGFTIDVIFESVQTEGFGDPETAFAAVE